MLHKRDLPFFAEEAAEEGDEEVEGIEDLEKKSHVPRSAWFFIGSR
jgi:hypothetical protein